MTDRPHPHAVAAPRRHLGIVQATVLGLGMIMTTDTLKTAPTVALNVGDWHYYGLWVAGGLISMVGAMCYVEMATAFPDPGGDYTFLRKAYGPEMGLLFAWSRFSIMHTGWIALMAFMFADYAGALVPLGRGGHTAFALATVAVLAGLNLMHVRRGVTTQVALVALVAAGFASVVAAVIWLGIEGQLPPAGPNALGGTAPAPSLGKLSVAMVYIFLAYGGWSDAATLSAEVRSDRRGMLAAILGSLTVLMAIYLALNAAMMIGLGTSGLAHSVAPAADLLGKAFGKAGQSLVVAVVGISAVASINSTLIVGARTTYAAARDVPALAAIGRWDGARGVPARAVLAEAAVAMLLVLAGSLAASGFNAMVDYMTPVYWAFMSLSIGGLMILRRRFPKTPRPVRTPLYPLFPVSFLAISLYMFVAGLIELGVAALYGAAVMAAGLAIVIGLRLLDRRGLSVAVD